MTTVQLQKISRIDHVITDPRADFFGIPVLDLPMSDLVRKLEHHLLHRESTHIVNLNPHHFLFAREDHEFGKICASGDIVFADGIGIVFASVLQDERVHNRYTGLDVMVRLCALSAEKSYSVFLFGGQHGIVHQCAEHLRQLFPTLKIAGVLEPPNVRDIDEFDNEEIVRLVNETHPDFLFVALGAPKQEKWIERFRNKLNVPILMGVGGSFDILGGRFSRAPRWMRAFGFEWLHRLRMEPRRLAGRYLIGIPRFLVLVVRLKFRSKMNQHTQ
jgi:N-acetylglucosaminyldiphosphoundecaprenol N-acetyl-beta-D-mannosaminyltransferase